MATHKAMTQLISVVIIFYNVKFFFELLCHFYSHAWFEQQYANSDACFLLMFFFLILLKCIRFWCQRLWIYFNENIWKFLVCLWMRSIIWSKTPINLFRISWIFLFYYCPSRELTSPSVTIIKLLYRWRYMY